MERPIVAASKSHKAGRKLFLEGKSPTNAYSTVFEDEGDVAYFYAQDGLAILDALLVYNVAWVTDRHRPSTFTIVWSASGLKSALLINNYPHPLFDFGSRRGYCRTDFPTPFEGWGDSFRWDDELLDSLAEPFEEEESLHPHFRAYIEAHPAEFFRVE